ncbi:MULTISPECIES: response regulator transcription factor [Fluviicola]|uniref:response regulator transcription factor n=1 Tax=Fluviicola TaxID=332102 RepID=UPI003137CBE2
MEQIIKIGLVEDQLLFRTGIKAILSSWKNLEVVFESGDGYSVIEKLAVESTIPDVMLVDLSLPPNGSKEYSGENLTIDLNKFFPQIKIIILSVHRDENYMARLIETGAHGYLVKDSDPQEVYEAIHAVYSKGSYINELTLKAIQRNLGKKSKPLQPVTDLTKREVEILQLTCQQYTAEEIANKLFISVKTVNGHRNNLLQKTGSRNVTGLVIYAIKNQLVELV